ncbi:MAG: thioredoxin domain-containing protein [Actinobacteria bacterium ATB1]|nr:thioredoxin domain-containing protein [Actinobacteria bacterium ATB1]
MPNRLAGESSPYLLAHKDNPVDWYPWGEAALRRAREMDRPIFLSIGYSACHWCHVMERESFEDPETAALLNDWFVSIKVDREERPDIDAIYMDAVQALTGQGGWPMSVWLTPEGVPFYGGTYFPPTDRTGMPSFRRVLEALHKAWEERRDEVSEQSRQLQDALSKAAALVAGDVPSGALDTAVESIVSAWDEENGGLGTAPKFPQPMLLEFLLRRWRSGGDDRLLTIVEGSLRRMVEGGLYDHLGGGFARYSVDAHWSVPHFEKMLYDNALLVPVYLHAWQTTGRTAYRRTVEQTLDWMGREMLQPSGGLSSSQDADSEGVEGKFFVWTPSQIESVLGPEVGGRAARYFGVTAEGNFEAGTTVLTVSDREALTEGEVAEVRGRLFEEREKRVRPATDDKVLASWNGLALAAYAEAGRALGRQDYTDIAVGVAEHVLGAMSPDGTLHHAWRDGRTYIPGFCEDYACVSVGLLELYQSTFDERWFLEARRLTDEMLERFEDPRGGFFSTAEDVEQLVVRPKEVLDNAVPSPNSMAADACARLAKFTGEERYETAARNAISVAGAALARHATGFGRALCVAAFLDSDPVELAIVGPDPGALAEVAFSAYRPFLVTAGAADTAGTAVPLLSERPAGSTALAYVCRGFTCLRPTSDPAELAGELG